MRLICAIPLPEMFVCLYVIADGWHRTQERFSPLPLDRVGAMCGCRLLVGAEPPLQMLYIFIGHTSDNGQHNIN
jgi:hypothetical protein